MSDNNSSNPRIPSVRDSNLRALNEDELSSLEKQNSRLVSEFKANMLEVNAHKHWDQFYKRNKTNFFKDRHWTLSEFSEILNVENLNGKCLFEVGCGVGNFLFPLLEEKLDLKICACDFSQRAIDFVKEHTLYDPERVTAFVADITKEDMIEHFETTKADIVTLIFVLSAVHPTKILASLRNLHLCMETGGVVLFRDYAVNDMTQVRFKPGHKIAENLYMRQDGTRTFFFTVEWIRNAFLEAGFEEEECNYVHCRTVNKKESVDAPRTFVQAIFRKK